MTTSDGSILSEWRLSEFTIAVTNNRPHKDYKPEKSTVCFSRSRVVGKGVTENFKCAKPLTGRYVVVSIAKKDILTLCEVEVFERGQ
jgi:hypothetical protein